MQHAANVGHHRGVPTAHGFAIAMADFDRLMQVELAIAAGLEKCSAFWIDYRRLK